LAGSAFAVRTVEDKPFTSRPKPPFMTSTLQQEGGRKLRMSAAQVMRVAQDLYQNGYITYMRTDSTTLSETALTAARSQVRSLFGAEYVPPAPRTYDRKVKNAQEAHEAIRPAGEVFRTPQELAGELRADQLKLYELIWMRTVASQMVDARGFDKRVRIGAVAADGRDAEFAASGRTITFPGYLKAYVEGTDDGSNESDEAKLPDLTEGLALPTPALEAKGHSTQPPARYTEASLVKRLEELGIGRPSTYASIMTTIQDRGYVWKKGTALVPTWTAFAVIKLLEEHFADVVDYAFTARMEDELDEIAAGRVQREPWLNQFWFGDAAGEQPADLADVSPGSPGLKVLVEQGKDDIDPAEINVVGRFVTPDGEEILVKPGKFGPYLKRGEDTASIPDDLTPDELDVFKAIELLDAPNGDRVLGDDPETGLPIYVKAGRFGPYVQVGDMPEGVKGKVKPEDKPKTASLFKTMSVERITLEDALQLLSLPRVVGTDPTDGGVITAQNGRYGPYISKAWTDPETGADKTDSRSIETEEQIFDITLEQALKTMAEPKRRRGQSAAGPLRELGVDPVSEKQMVIKDGRFGPYVTDGETNASLRKGDEVETLTDERASELLQIRRDAGPSKKKAAKKKAPAKKKAAAKKAPAKKKAAAKKAPAKKRAAAKKAPAASTDAAPSPAPLDDDAPF
jgi:DNA topoisomerase-1